MTFPVTLVIPTLPERKKLAVRAFKSAEAQTQKFHSILLEPSDGEDAAATRQRGLEKVETPWVTFLDDDDELEPDHLESLLEYQLQSDADIVYSWFTVYENDRPVPDDSRQLWLNGKSSFGREWSEEHVDALMYGRWCFHLTALFRTEMILGNGGFQAPNRGRPDWYLSEDLDLEQRLVKAGARVVHCPRRTWRWYFWDGRTKGQPSQ